MVINWTSLRSYFSQLKDLSNVGLGNILATGIGAIFWIYIARIVGTEGYGQLSYLLAIAGLAVSISSLGSSTSLTVYRAKEIPIQATFFLITIISGFVASISLFFITNNSAIAIFPFGYAMFSLSSAELLGRKLFKKYSIVMFSQRVVMIVSALTLYHFLGIQGILLGYSVSFYPYLYLVVKGFRESKIDFSLFRPRLHFVIGNYVYELIGTLGSTVDKMIIFPLFGASLLGQYHLGQQILQAMIILPYIVFQYVLPHDASGNANKKLKAYTILCSAILAILAIILSPLLVPLLFKGFDKSIVAIQIMGLNVIPYSISIMLKSEFFGSEKIKTVLYGSGIALGIIVVGILTLGRYFDIYGLSITVLLAGIAEVLYYTIIRIRDRQSSISRMS